MLLALPLLATTAGAIYLEGQAPPDGTDVRILAASSGLAPGGIPDSADKGVSTGGPTTSLSSPGFGYPSMSDLSMPNVPILSMSSYSIPRYEAADVASIASTGYLDKPGNMNFKACMPRFKPARMFGV